MGAALVSPCVFPESISMPPPSGVNNIFALLDEDNDNEDDGFTVVAKTAKPAKAAPKEEPKREARKQKTDRPARGGKGDKRRDDRPYDGADKSEPPAKEEGRKGGKGERREGKGERKSEKAAAAANSIARARLAAERDLPGRAVETTTGVTRPMVLPNRPPMALLLMVRTRLHHPPRRKRRKKRTP